MSGTDTMTIAPLQRAKLLEEPNAMNISSRDCGTVNPFQKSFCHAAQFLSDNAKACLPQSFPLRRLQPLWNRKRQAKPT
jgi:hypothetical protein